MHPQPPKDILLELQKLSSTSLILIPLPWRRADISDLLLLNIKRQKRGHNTFKERLQKDFKWSTDSYSPPYFAYKPC
jgi:hypothetical protein